MTSGKAVLIDTDPGTDDAIALLMAMGAEGLDRLDLLGVTTVGGNVPLARTTRNALALLEYAGRGDIPVASGASRPLRGAFRYAHYFHGPGGLTARIPNPRNTPSPETAVELLAGKIDAHRSSASDGVTLVTLGPLTNVARLIGRHPEVQRRLSEVVVMGGAVGVPGNVTPYAEFNFYSDPLAAQIVLSSGLAVTLVDLSVCRQASIGRAGLGPLLHATGPGGLAGRILTSWFRRNPGKESYDLCDPLAMAVAMAPNLLTTQRGTVDVETSPGEHLGQSTFIGSKGNVRVPTGLDIENFFELFYRTLA